MKQEISFPEVNRSIVKSDEGLEFHQEIDLHAEDYPAGITEDDLGAYTIPDTPGVGLLALLYGPRVAGLKPAYGMFPRPGSHTVAEIDGTDDEHPTLKINYRGYTDEDCQLILGLPASRIPVS